MPAANFDRIARPYRWLEYLSFGPMLERVRFCRIPQLAHARRALVLGDGDGRFLARLLAANPLLHADAVDQSRSMLRLLEARVSAAGARDRVRIHHADALAFNLAELRDCAASQRDAGEQPQKPGHPGAERVCLDGQSPDGPYDLVVTHFFLDCLSTEEVQALVAHICPHLGRNARWLVSEFAIPSGLAALPAKSLVAALYAAFRVITGLRTRKLPDYAAVLAGSGFTLESRRGFLGGLLVSELWEKPVKGEFCKS